MFVLELIKEQGWILKGEKIPTNCHYCKEELEKVFFFDKEREQAICRRCEEVNKNVIRISLVLSVDCHELFHVIGTEQEEEK